MNQLILSAVVNPSSLKLCRTRTADSAIVAEASNIHQMRKATTAGMADRFDKTCPAKPCLRLISRDAMVFNPLHTSFYNEPFAWFPSYQESFDDIYIDYEDEDYEDDDSDYDSDDLDVGYA